MSTLNCLSATIDLQLGQKAPIRLQGNRLAGTFYLVLLLFAGLLQSSHTLAANDVIKTKYQYSAKVLCSLLLPHQDGSLARGTYRTVVNIHNPTEKKIVIVEKIALADQLGTPPGPFSVTPFRKTHLGPDGALQINCGNIAGFFCPINGVCVDFAFLDGFLVIRSPVELDVVGVYTARHTEGDVETIDVEAVQARKVSAAVEVPAGGEEQGTYDRVPYPPHASMKHTQMCGGIAGIVCPEGQICVDDPTDSCDPAKGGADCSGICTDETKPSQSYAPKTPPAAGPIPDTGISLGETVCLGACPEYTITSYPNEFYELNAGQFTVNPGESTGTLPAGSFATANAALQAASFNSLPTDITPGNPAACGNPVATDLPTATISETTIAGTRTVTYYQGCLQAPDKAALGQLVADLRTALQVETLVTPP